ncbi:MAG TPA: hypothetical protein VK843_19660 [Planctomycetota bacterium]|nr:hypothetical protein [Planctomycetota bacterium]
MQRVLLSLVLGMLIGALGVSLFLDARPMEPAANPARSEERAAPIPVPAGAIAPPERTAENRAPISSEAEPEGLISAALRRYVEECLRQAWKSVREDEIPAPDLAKGMAKFENNVMVGPEEIGTSLAKRRSKAEAALADEKTGGVFNLLERLNAGEAGPMPELVRDPARFAALFQRVASEHLRSGLEKRAIPDDSIADGETLTWPAGVFRVEGLLQTKEKFPRDVTVAGAGMNSTMLVLIGPLMTTSDLRNFTIRDCTVNTNNNYLFQLSNKASSIQLERVRFVGFDMGAGSSCLLGTNAVALSVRNCRIEGGYGKWPEHGTLLDVRTDALVARFEFCSISLLTMHVDHMRPGATALFVGCTLDEILDNPQGDALDHPGVMFEGCTIARQQGGRETIPNLDLNALFPNWKNRME